MADVEYSVETRFEGDDDLRRAAQGLEDVGERGRRAFDDIEQKARGGLGLLNLEAGISLVGQAMGTLQGVAIPHLPPSPKARRWPTRAAILPTCQRRSTQPPTRWRAACGRRPEASSPTRN